MGCWNLVWSCLVLAGGLRALIRTGVPENLVEQPTVASPQDFLAALSESGQYVFTGLGEEYEKAVQNLRKNSPNCLQDSLEVELDDGSRRFTIARDSGTDTSTFPPCVQEDIEIVTKHFDRVDKFVMEVLKYKFNTSLQISVGQDSYELEDLPMKSHLHVYEKDLRAHAPPSALSLPFHTDSGLYLLLTPSPVLPLQVLGRSGSLTELSPCTTCIIFLTGTGLSEWLLPGEELYAPPHAVPSITSSPHLTRTVLARMKVAPLHATTPRSGNTFGQHFYSGLGGGWSTKHQARVRRQVQAVHAQHWIGAPTNTTSTG